MAEQSLRRWAVRSHVGEFVDGDDDHWVAKQKSLEETPSTAYRCPESSTAACTTSIGSVVGLPILHHDRLGALLIRLLNLRITSRACIPHVMSRKFTFQCSGCESTYRPSCFGWDRSRHHRVGRRTIAYHLPVTMSRVNHDRAQPIATVYSHLDHRMH